MASSGSIVKSCLFAAKDAFGLVEMTSTSTTAAFTANGTRSSSRPKSQLATQQTPSQSCNETAAAKCTLRTWKQTQPHTSPLWVHPTQTPQSFVNITIEENSVLLTTIVESQHSLHLIFQNSTLLTSTWIKVDFSGRELFRIQLEFCVLSAQIVKDEIFMTSKSSQSSVLVTSWSTRYGTKIQNITVQMPARSNSNTPEVLKMCFQSQEKVALIFAIPSPTSTSSTSSSEGMTIYRRELTSHSTPGSSSEISSSSLLGMILGANKRQKVDTTVTSAKANDNNELQMLQNQYRQLIIEENENVELTMDYFQLDKRKRRRPMDMLTISSHVIQVLFYDFYANY